ncbi:MAG TPA: hypothetical protein PLU73_07120 [Bacteroidia bacterium]|jgi:hypothetical protein|nr:hypothetical protein [Bacteroidia bacterium]
MKRKAFVIISFFLSSGYYFSQTKSNPSTNIAIGAPAPGLHVINTAAEQSDYFGFDNKIKAITIDGTVPINLPTKKGYLVRAEYKAVINDWFKAHNALVKPEFQSTLIQD